MRVVKGLLLGAACIAATTVVAPGGLFDGEHSFTLTPKDSGTEFVQSECFSGLFVCWFTKSVVFRTEDSFRAMNDALRRRVEQSLKG